MLEELRLDEELLLEEFLLDEEFNELLLLAELVSFWLVDSSSLETAKELSSFCLEYSLLLCGKKLQEAMIRDNKGIMNTNFFFITLIDYCTFPLFYK